MSKREQRVIQAFINVVKSGEYTYDHASILMNDAERYGYLSEEAKEPFYAEFEATAEEPTEAETEA